MTINLNTILGNNNPLYNGIYPERPVWGYCATTNTTAPNATNHFMVTFAPNRPRTPMTTHYGTGSSQSNVQRTPPANEVDSSYYFSGSASQGTSQSLSPTNGYVGPFAVTQTGAYFNFNAYDNGAWAHERSQERYAIGLHSGVVVGESRFNQTYDLFAYDGKIMKSQTGLFTNYLTTPATNPEFFFVSSQMFTGTQYSTPTGINAGLGAATMTSSTDTTNNGSRVRNNGMICHNRNSGKLAYLETLTTTGTWRMHIIDLENQITQSTKLSEIKTSIEAAVTAGDSRYDYYDITLPSWNQGSTVQACNTLRIVLCDDDTVWIVGWDKDDSSSAGTLRLYRSTNPDTYTFSLVNSISNSTTSYGVGTGDQYGLRHMNSDDNTRVAMYVQDRQYNNGIMCYIVDTRTAVADGIDQKWMRIVRVTSACGFSIVPVGQGDFFLGDSQTNADSGAGAQGMYLNASGPLLGDQRTYSVNIISLPTITQSTSYSSWIALKIQPTQEYKPFYER